MDIPARLVVMLSGEGRTLQNLAEKARDGELPVRIVKVISSHCDVRGLERAEGFGIPHQVVNYREFGGDPKGFSEAITAAVDEVEPDLIALAGFLRKWSFPDRYKLRVLNIHPALLPSFGGKGFYGETVHRSVLESGARFSGCTVHYADQEYDRGPIILQRIVPVHDDDTADSLAQAVFEQECIAYPEAIRATAEGRLELREGRICFRDASTNRSMP